VLAYSHDGYGLGHLRRNLRIAVGLRQIRPDVEVLLATGAKDAGQLVSAQGIDHVQLPPVVKTGAGRYESASGVNQAIEDIVARRSAILERTVADFAPDILLADRHARGLHRELDPALGVHRRRGQARAVLGLRDILDEPAVIEREWEQYQITSAIEDYYDEVLCYGDRSVYDQVAEYALPDAVAGRLRYTGYLADAQLGAGAAPVAPADRAELRGPAGARLVVCTLGGGQDASPIAAAFLAAMRYLRAAGDWRGVLVTGPYMAEDAVAELRRHPDSDGVLVIRMTSDLPGYLAAADVAFCMGGYNTTCEVLALGVPAVIVPRITPRLEQLMRARRLAERGLVHWLHPDGLTPRVVAGALSYVAGTPRDDLRDRLATVAHQGVATTAQRLSELLSDRRVLMKAGGSR
jgi:predicted glycosyltransferase